MTDSRNSTFSLSSSSCSLTLDTIAFVSEPTETDEQLKHTREERGEAVRRNSCTFTSPLLLNQLVVESCGLFQISALDNQLLVKLLFKSNDEKRSINGSRCSTNTCKLTMHCIHRQQSTGLVFSLLEKANFTMNLGFETRFQH